MKRMSIHRQVRSIQSLGNKIPVYVNTFNRLTTTRLLVEQISRFENSCPIIVDNGSTWGPLLDWYKTDPCEIIRLNQNLGCRAVWKAGLLKQNPDWYVVTDCDLDLSGVPFDVLEHLKTPFRWRGRRFDKSGLALRIDDIPDWQYVVRQWESKFWRRQVPFDPRFYFADVDTTFALYRRNSKVDCARCTRAAGEYQARHVPWYLDCNFLDEENQYYYRTASKDNSWKPTGRHLSGTGYEGFDEKE